MQRRPNLIASPGYLAMTLEERARICNGMGAKDSLLSGFIPNTMFGLDVSEAGNIHDYDYHMGVTAEDKRNADRNFLINMLAIINAKGGLLSFFRRSMALKYYEAVHYFGFEAFWKG